jgi:hypothetical protein
VATAVRTELEFRIPEVTAKRILTSEEGEVIAGIARKWSISDDDPRLEDFRNISIQLRLEGEAPFTSWAIRRSYSEDELQDAELLRLIPETTIEPAGQELGTIYDESSSCVFCGAGRLQISALRVDPRRAPSNIHFAKTIAEDEWICSRQVSGLISELNNDAVAISPVETKSPRFVEWHQLRINEGGPKLRVSSRTEFGIDPFDDDREGKYRCPLGHVVGLRVLSEVWVDREGVGESDISISNEFVGIKRGLLRPSRMIFVSVSAWNRLRHIGSGGWSVEVAHLS